MRYEESVYKSLEETRPDQLNQAEILCYRSMNAEIMIIQRMLQKLSTFVSQRPDGAPQSARGVFDYTKFNEDQQRDELGRFALVGGSGSPGKGEMNIAGAIAFLNAKADPDPPGKRLCATYVRAAIVEGGGVTLKPPLPPVKDLNYAKDYHPYLKDYFKEEIPTPKPDYTPQEGDIAVFQPPDLKHKEGHIQMYNGTQWVSDFKQPNGFWPGPTYREIMPNYSIYRPRDWKPDPK